MNESIVKEETVMTENFKKFLEAISNDSVITKSHFESLKKVIR